MLMPTNAPTDEEMDRQLETDINHVGDIQHNDHDGDSALGAGYGDDYEFYKNEPVSPREQRLTRSINAIDVPHNKIHNIACIGAGHVGGPTSAVIAYKNPDIKVTIVDLDPERIEAWNSPSLPIFERDLDEIVFVARDGRSSDFGEFHYR